MELRIRSRRRNASGRVPQRASSRTTTGHRAARKAAGVVYDIEIVGPWELAAMEALKLDLCHLARRYGAVVEDFRVEM